MKKCALYSFVKELCIKHSLLRRLCVHRFIAVLSVICIFVCTCVYCSYYVSKVFVLCLCLYYVCVCTMSCLYYVYCVCTVFMCLYYVYHLTTGLLDLDAGRLARSQNPEGPATGHLDPGFLGFPGS